MELAVASGERLYVGHIRRAASLAARLRHQRRRMQPEDRTKPYLQERPGGHEPPDHERPGPRQTIDVTEIAEVVLDLQGRGRAQRTRTGRWRPCCKILL